MLKSHDVHLDITCLKLVQNWIIDCPLEEGVISTGLAILGLLQQVTEDSRLLRYYAVST
jgi:hypothetical protein